MNDELGEATAPARRGAHNRIPQDQDDFLMAQARAGARARDAVRAFLDRFPPSTTCDPAEAERRATFLYRHRLRRARAEQVTLVLAPPASVRLGVEPGQAVAAGQAVYARLDGERAPTAVSPDPAVGPLVGRVASADGRTAVVDLAGSLAAVARDPAGGGPTVDPPRSAEPQAAPEPDGGFLVGDRVVVVRGHAALNCVGVVKDLLPFPEHTHSVGVAFDEGVGLWFPPSHLRVVPGGLDGAVARAEAERDQARADLARARADLEALARSVAEQRARASLSSGIDAAGEQAQAGRQQAQAGELGSLRAELDAARREAAATRDELERVVRGAARVQLDPLAVLEALRESAAAARAVSDAVQALSAQQADAMAAKDAEVASLRLHIDDLRRQAGL